MIDIWVFRLFFGIERRASLWFKFYVNPYDNAKCLNIIISEWMRHFNCDRVNVCRKIKYYYLLKLVFNKISNYIMLFFVKLLKFWYLFVLTFILCVLTNFFKLKPEKRLTKCYVKSAFILKLFIDSVFILNLCFVCMVILVVLQLNKYTITAERILTFFQ